MSRTSGGGYGNKYIVRFSFYPLHNGILVLNHSVIVLYSVNLDPIIVGANKLSLTTPCFLHT